MSQICNEAKINGGANNDDLIEELRKENEMLKMQLSYKDFEAMSFRDLSESELKE